MIVKEGGLWAVFCNMVVVFTLVSLKLFRLYVRNKAPIPLEIKDF